MNIDLSNLKDNVDKIYYFDGEIDDHGLDETLKRFEIISPIKYEGEIIKLEESDIINVNIEYEYKTKCDRCLEDAVNRVKTSLSGKLKDYGESSEKEDEEDEEDIVYYRGGFLNLNKYIIMEVASSLPMKFLCSKDCKGLCPQCGINLSEESCDCVDSIVDPRLEKLKEFFIDD